MNQGLYDAEIAHTFYSPLPPIRRNQWSTIRHAESTTFLPEHLADLGEYHRLVQVTYNNQGAIITLEEADRYPSSWAQIPLVHIAFRGERIGEIAAIHEFTKDFEQQVERSRWGLRTLLGNVLGELPPFPETDH